MSRAAKRAAAQAAAAAAAGAAVKWSPSPKHRDYMARWPAGEVRDGVSLWKFQLTHDHMVHAQAAGYVTALSAVTQGTQANGYRSEYTAKRTAKPMRPYKPMAVKPAYDGLFPWSIDEHWQRMCESPSRISVIIAAKLRGEVDINERSLFTRRPIEDKLAAPIFLRTKSELRDLRLALGALCGVPLKNARRAKYFEDSGHVGQLEALVMTGVGLRLLCLDMLVEPVFEVMPGLGLQFVRFGPLDPDAALAELQRVGGRGTLLEKYQSYMEER